MITTQTVIELAKKHYNITATASLLAGELDLNYYLVSDKNQRYILKLHSALTDTAVLDMQTKALLFLHEHNKGLGTPQIILTRLNEPFVCVELENTSYTLRCLRWIDGDLWSAANPDPLESYWSLGRYLAELDGELETFTHPSGEREFLWDMRKSAEHQKWLHAVPTDYTEMVEQTLNRFNVDVLPVLQLLPSQMIHNDANDNNIVLDQQGVVIGLIDYGDMIYGHRITEIAIACCYAMCGQADPIASVMPLIAGYHSVQTLTDQELQLLYDLILCRCASSICMAARQIHENPDNEYLLVSQQSIQNLMCTLWRENRELAYFRFRSACGLSPNPNTPIVERWLSIHRSQFANICNVDLSDENNILELDLSTDGIHANEMSEMETAEQFTRFIFDLMKARNKPVGLGRYLEKRGVYKSAAFETVNPDERRDLHLGVDLFIAEGEPLYAPIDGVVECFSEQSDVYDFGPIIILRHTTDTGIPFWTLYGHLSRQSLSHVSEGQEVAKGETIGWVGSYPINGDWPPHTHFQVMSSLLGMGTSIHGVGHAAALSAWQSVCLPPDLILPLQKSSRAKVELSTASLLLNRRIRFGRMLSLAYKKPLKIVRGDMQYLLDHQGNRYLDMVNNVCHVGHCNPRVVAAGQSQMATLNTNTRYLHDNIVEFAQRLTATLPDPLNVCFFVNSGSEANDLALRIARNYTARRDIIVMDEGYHGNTTSLIEISPYKFNGRGGKGCPATTHICEMPNLYRGRFRYTHEDAAARYAHSVTRVIERMDDDILPAAFIAESLGGVSGQLVFPDGYFEHVYKMVRAVGGLCIADEVQVGLGRMGKTMWAFETQNVVPDIVTIGKPLGNGHPLAAVVTTTEIAESFNNGMEYFNTFGGNPVSAAIGLSVLDSIRHDNLMENAIARGNQMQQGLRELASRHPIIGDVRGIGLFVGAELVLDRETLEPATAKAAQLIDFLKTRNILLTTDGKYSNALKIKPPMCLSEHDVDHFINSIDEGIRFIG